MASGTAERKAEKSYLASAVDSINPWAGSRTSTPLPKDPQPSSPLPSTMDHAVNPFYGHSFKKYPPDCPPLKVQWFHAVDVSVAWSRYLLLRLHMLMSCEGPEAQAQIPQRKGREGR